MSKIYAMMKPILCALKTGASFSTEQIKELMNQQFPLTEKEIEDKLNKGKKPDLSEELKWALLYLKKAGLIDNPTRGFYIITEEGKKALIANPEIIDNAFLSKYESFKLFKAPAKQLFNNMLLVCTPVKKCISYRNKIKNHPHFSDFISAKYDVFTNELIDSIYNHSINEFRKKYTQCKVLILYDIELLVGKEATQEELYHILQARIDSGLKTVVLVTETPAHLSKSLMKKLYEILTVETVLNQIPDEVDETDTFLHKKFADLKQNINIQKYKQQLQTVKEQIENNEIDEIPLKSRPNMPIFDFEKDSYIIVSYSRKDFVEVYLLLAQLYNDRYRFWYDNGMKGTDEWLVEYKDKYKNRNCLGTLTFFSENYISNSTKSELEILYSENGYEKQNIMISLVSLKDIDPEKILKTAIEKNRISIKNAAEIEDVLTRIIKDEKQKTIHRYNNEEDIPYLVEKIGKAFNIREATSETNNQKLL